MMKSRSKTRYWMAQVHSSPEIYSGTPSESNISRADAKVEEPCCQDEPQIQSTNPTNAQKIAAEFIGTYLLIFIGCGSIFIAHRGDTDLLGVASAWGVVVAALVYTLGHISGSHFNPAITIAFATAGKFPWRDVAFYMVAQLMGSILASFTLRWLFDGDPATVMLSLPSPSSMRNVNVIAWEATLTFILMLVISGAAADSRSIKELSGVAVGAAVFANALVAGKITGASMNPARSLGPAIAAHNFHKLWMYIVAPFIGAIAGSTLYNLLSLPEKSKEKNVKNSFDRIKSKISATWSGLPV